MLFSFPLPRTQPYVVCSDFIYVSSYHCRAYPQDIHLRRTVKLFRPSRLLGTMASADFSQFVVTTDRAPSVRPHGISPEPFPVYSSDLRIEVTVAFGTLMLSAISSAQYALISGFCPSSHGFVIASSRLYLTIQTLQLTLRFVGNYAPRDFHPRFGTCPSYRKRVENLMFSTFYGEYIANVNKLWRRRRDSNQFDITRLSLIVQK